MRRRRRVKGDKKRSSRSMAEEEEEEDEEEEREEEEEYQEEEDDEEEERMGTEDGEEEDDGEGRGGVMGRGSGGGKERPGQRNAANARERARMRVLSRAFCKLKTTLPWVPPDTKLSKLDTLRLATSYIAHLRAMLEAEEAESAAQEKRTSGTPMEVGVSSSSTATVDRGGEGNQVVGNSKGRVSSLHPLNLTWPFSFQRTSSSSNSSSSSTSSTGTYLGVEWPKTVHEIQQQQQQSATGIYCQGGHRSIEVHQSCLSPTHHHQMHHNNSTNFLPSAYSDSSLLHI